MCKEWYASFSTIQLWYANIDHKKKVQNFFVTASKEAEMFPIAFRNMKTDSKDPLQVRIVVSSSCNAEPSPSSGHESVKDINT